MSKPFYQVMIEAIIVGQILIWVYYITKIFILPNITVFVDFTNNEIATLFISGFLFHIICEVTGVNVWYAKNYYSLLDKLEKTI